MTEGEAIGSEVAAEPVVASEAEPEQPETSGSTRDALEKAFEQAGIDDAGEAVEPDDQGQPRGPDGKFVAKEGAETPQEGERPEAEPKPAETQTDAPTRFSADAKAEWEKTPAPVKAETQRAIKEMEAGLQQYQQTVEPLKPWLEMANNDPAALSNAMQRYHNLEMLIQQDTAKGLDQICRNLGTSLQEVAAKVAGQTPEQQNTQQADYVRSLEQKIQALEGQVTGVSKTVEGQQLSAVQKQIEDFAADHPRFDELSEPITQLLQTGMAADLPKAYEMAERLNPAPAQPDPTPDPAAQTRKAELSVPGAPSSGSNPAHRQRSGTTSEAVRRAFAEVGFT